MSKELLAERIKLAKAYGKANAAAQVAQSKCREAADAVIAFDKAHPEITLAVKERAKGNKLAARAAEQALAGGDA